MIKDPDLYKASTDKPFFIQVMELELLKSRNCVD